MITEPRDVTPFITEDDVQKAEHRLNSLRRDAHLSVLGKDRLKLPEAVLLGQEMVYAAFCRYCGVDDIKAPWVIIKFKDEAPAVTAARERRIPLPVAESAAITGLLNHGAISALKQYYYTWFCEKVKKYLDDYAPWGLHLDRICGKKESVWGEI